MIVTAAIAKGGVGKSTLLRVLASVAAHRGYETIVIDGDVRRHMSRWSTLLEEAGRKPANLEIVSVETPEEMVAEAERRNHDKAVVFIDTEGTTNDMLMAGLYAADIVAVPVFYALDDVTAAVQLVDHYIPLAEASRGRPLPALYVLTKQTVIDAKAKALRELRAIIQESGTPIASNVLQSRVSYRDLQTGTTLYTSSAKDAKAIAEGEAVFDDVVEALITAIQKAA